MNIRYFLILIVAVSLSLSGCAYKATQGGYNFEAQVVAKDGFPTLIAKCIPTESKADLEITGDLIPGILKKLFKLAPVAFNQTELPDTTSPDMIEDSFATLRSTLADNLTNALKKDLTGTSTSEVLRGNEDLIKLVREQAKQAQTLKDVLKSAIENGSLACPPSSRREEPRGIQKPISVQESTRIMTTNPK